MLLKAEAEFEVISLRFTECFTNRKSYVNELLGSEGKGVNKSVEI